MVDASPPVLSGWYVISLRPSGAHAPLRRVARVLGAQTLPLSTLRLVPQAATAALAAALACPVVIATSPAAVRFADRQQAVRGSAGVRWLAVGGGTAAALRRAGATDVRAPDGGGDSESLLALPDLAAPAGTDIGLVTAPGGRGLIAETLAQRGARVHRAEVYRREPATPRADRLRTLAALPAQSALLVSSAEAFDGLWSRLDDIGRARLRPRPAVASSARLAVMLAAHGFTAIVPADGASPARLLRALCADVASGRFR